jgi:hypothetical protein
MTVTTSNVFSEARDQLKSIINSNVTDPKIGSTNSRRKWIYREFPDTTSRDFAGYPIIVITSPELEDDIQDLQGCLSNGELNMTVSIFVEFNDTNARIDTISNSVYSVLRSNRNTLLSNNLDLLNIQAGPFDSQDEDGKKLSTRQFLVPFSSTLEV